MSCAGVAGRASSMAGSKARWFTSARTPARLNSSHRRRQLRQHQIVDGPVLAAARRDADLAEQDRFADPLDPPHQAGVDMEGVLVEDQVGLERLDLRQQDRLGGAIEPRAEADLARQRPQHRLERRDRALQPAGERPAAAWLRARQARRQVHARAPRPIAARDC